MVKINNKGKIFFISLFMIIFASLNIWIINHSGPVRFLSMLSIKYFHYWSSTLSFGLPIILGVFLFILIFGIFYMKGIFFISDPNVSTDGVEKFKQLELFLKSARKKAESKKLAIILQVIGIEMTAMACIDYWNLSSINTLAKCNAEQISMDKCSSKWVILTNQIKNTKPLISIEKSTQVTHYISVKDHLPLLIKMEMHRSPSIMDPFPKIITGIVETMNPSHFVFLDKRIFPFEENQIKIINLDLSPEKNSTIKIIVSLLMSMIGFFLFIKKKTSVKE